MTKSAIQELIRTQYGIDAQLSRLAGENENYLVETADLAYVLKMADQDTDTGLIEIEHLAVESLIEAGIALSLPKIIPTRNNEIEARYRTPGGELLRGRLLAFVKGTPWCDDAPAPAARLRDLGSVMGKLSKAMSTIIHPDAQRTHHWDLAMAHQHRGSVDLIENDRRRQILEQTFLQFETIARPRLPHLPHGPIHGDINDDNVLIMGDRVAGILDFGDCLENPLVCDLAIALAYHTLDEPKPLDAAALVVAAYHGERPLVLEEVEVLFPLLCTRLAVSVIISAQRRAIDPDRESWFVSEERAWKKLEAFSNIPPAAAARTLAAGIDMTPCPEPDRPADVVAEQRRQYIAPSMSVSYDRPIQMVRGRGQFLYDVEGRPYLDLYNNVCHVGHCHPHVVAAGQQQMARLNTNTRYLYDGLGDYAQRLTATLPDELDTCFFLNSGSEANELALRMTKTVTRREDVLVVDNAYHGHTQAMIHISPYKFMGKGGKGAPEPWVHVVPVADGYRGNHKGQKADQGKAYGDEVGQLIKKINRPVAGFITESLLSCGGQVIPPARYFKTAFDHVRKNGGLCICDEVQTGFGRTGQSFWAFELQDVVPDIVVMGKPMGNGHPMAAVVTRREIAEKFANGMEFFATFGGNPVSCAVGMAVLDVIEQERLQKNAKTVGGHMLEGLLTLKDRHPIIGDVRGLGLFIGIELVLDRDTLAPATETAAAAVNRLREAGILLGTDGPYNNVIKIKPPMVITREDADMFVRVFDRILTQLAIREGTGTKNP